MRTVLVTGSDTGVGKTRVTGAIARVVAAAGQRVQIVKVVETGVAPGGLGDAACAAAGAVAVDGESGHGFAGSGGSGPAAGSSVGCLKAGGAPQVRWFTLFSFGAALAPAAAALAEGRRLGWEAVMSAVAGLPADAGWRVYEGAGGIASPIDDARDWADFARAMAVDFVVLVVPDRIGAINQARLAFARAAGLNAGIWLNAVAPSEPAVMASTREALRGFSIPIWAEQPFGAAAPIAPPPWLNSISRPASGGMDGALCVPADQSPPSTRPGESGAGAKSAIADPFPATQTLAEALPASPQRGLMDRWATELGERERRRLLRRVRLTRVGERGAAVSPAEPGLLNLADNDYLALAFDPAVVAGAVEAAQRWGASASASPLITGWREPHEALMEALKAWHGYPHGLLWTSGFAANGSVLSTLPAAGDLVLADRLIHHSMVAGLLRSGARLQRYPHLDLNRLEALLAKADGRATLVVTESVFSMDGDYPDLARIAALKRRHGFYWVLDEAHGLGWYGPGGAGLAAGAGADVAAAVDVLVGTFGKALASGGAYALFRDGAARERVLNHAGEFIYSTALPPPSAGAALAAIGRARALAPEQPRWHEVSRAFRAALRADGWQAPEGDSPIVPIRLDDEQAALGLADALRAEGIWTAAVRPPTVPAGTSRLRLSLKRTFSPADAARVRAALARRRERGPP